ncbi:MAG: hypothetical protein ACTSU5_10140 [Promethearchaeota archaeon]
MYTRNFSHVLEDTDQNLLSSFMTAILDFCRNVVEKHLNILEIGDLRFFFRDLDGRFTVVLITDATASVILVNERFKLIRNALLESFGNDGASNVTEASGAVLDLPELDAKVDEIVRLTDGDSVEAIQEVREVFENEIVSGEISAGALISMDGEIYYTSLPDDDLHFALRELEIRAQAQTRDLETMPKSIWQAGERMIFSQVILSSKFAKPLYVILLFERGATLGIADYALEVVVKKLLPLL